MHVIQKTFSLLTACIACCACISDGNSSNDANNTAANVNEANDASMIRTPDANPAMSPDVNFGVNPTDPSNVVRTPDDTASSDEAITTITPNDQSADPCARFASGFARCMNERCPATTPVRAITERSAEMFCILGHASGSLVDTDLETALNPDTNCNNRAVDQIFEPRLRDDGEYSRGDLVQFCEEGPLRAVSLCQQACANLEPCIDQASDAAFLRNAAFCEEFCISREGPTTEQWSCALDYTACRDIFECFEHRPLAICEEFGPLGATCLADRCEASIPVQEGAEVFFDAICRGGIRDGTATPTLYRRAIDNGSCTRGFTDLVVTFFTEEWPDQPESGSLAPFCNSGVSLRPAAICDAACNRANECIPEDPDGSRFGETEVCQFYCQSSALFPSDTWQCLAESSGCSGFSLCFQN